MYKAETSLCLQSTHVWMWELDHKEDRAKELMLSNCGAREDSSESLGQQGDQTSQSIRKSTLHIHWKNWCWIWSCHTLDTWCRVQFIRKDPHPGKDWRKEKKRLAASLIQWTWTWPNAERWWRTGRPGMLQSMESQGSDTTEQHELT